MARGASARRYAQAVFAIALEQGEPGRWLDDLALLSDAMANDDFANFLDAPQPTLSQKINLIEETLGDSVSRLALNLVSLLASRNSARLARSITESYQEMLDEYNGIERAEIVSAITLSDEQQQRIETMLKDIVGKEHYGDIEGGAAYTWWFRSARRRQGDRRQHANEARRFATPTGAWPITCAYNLCL